MLKPLASEEFEDYAKKIQKTIDENDLGALVSSITHHNIHRLSEDNYKKYFNDSPAEMFGLFNDFGQRCDDFKKDHQGKLHVLYAGCSFTYGEGVPLDRTWAWEVHKYINEEIAETSGYFNVGRGGFNFTGIQNQIMGYMSYSGKPDVILINLPEIGREFLQYKHPMRSFNDKKDNSDIAKKQSPSTISVFRQSLINFSIMCKTMGIHLVIGCWAMNTHNFNDIIRDYENPFRSTNVIDVAGGLDVLHNPEPYDMGYPDLESELLSELGEDNPLRNIIYLAMDELHPGLLGHKIMAKNFINHLKTIDIQAAI